MSKLKRFDSDWEQVAMICSGHHVICGKSICFPRRKFWWSEGKCKIATCALAAIKALV
jgi:hypothetical protein